MKKTVCVDLDGVLAEYDGWKDVTTFIGKPYPGALEFIKTLSEKYRILIYTARTETSIGIEAVQEWLEKNHFTDFRVVLYLGTDKPKAIAYVDDRAVLCRPAENGNSYEQALTRIRLLDV
ncbi:MAG: hypothetical protein JSW62_06090 [Thermoplasmatales archaeon]|nr:MAG: hypothetical protein JSW62_06090 [Thermoplasmatales archaeon]